MSKSSEYIPVATALPSDIQREIAIRGMTYEQVIEICINNPEEYTFCKKSEFWKEKLEYDLENLFKLDRKEYSKLYKIPRFVEDLKNKVIYMMLIDSAKKGRYNYVVLLDQIYDAVKLKPDGEYPAIYYAVQSGHLNIVKYLFGKTNLGNFSTAIMGEALKNDNLDIIEFLIDGMKMNDYTLKISLNRALDKISLYVMKYLIESRNVVIDLDTLKDIVKESRIEIIKYILLKFSVSPTTANDLIKIVALDGREKVLQMLLNKYEKREEERNSLFLRQIAEKGYYNILKILLDDGRFGILSTFSLVELSKRGLDDMVKLILSTSMEHDNYFMEMAMHEAQSKNHLRIVKLLLTDKIFSESYRKKFFYIVNIEQDMRKLIEDFRSGIITRESLIKEEEDREKMVEYWKNLINTSLTGKILVYLEKNKDLHVTMKDKKIDVKMLNGNLEDFSSMYKMDIRIYLDVYSKSMNIIFQIGTRGPVGIVNITL